MRIENTSNIFMLNAQKAIPKQTQLMSKLLQQSFAQRTDTISPKMQAQLDKLAEAKKVEEIDSYYADPDNFGRCMGFVLGVQTLYTNEMEKYAVKYEAVSEQIAKLEKNMEWKEQQASNGNYIFTFTAKDQESSSFSKKMAEMQQELTVTNLEEQDMHDVSIVDKTSDRLTDDKKAMQALQEKKSELEDDVVELGEHIQKILASVSDTWKAFEPYFGEFMDGFIFALPQEGMVSKDSKDFLKDLKAAVATMQKVMENNTQIGSNFVKRYNTDWKKELYQSYFSKKIYA